VEEVCRPVAFMWLNLIVATEVVTGATGYSSLSQWRLDLGFTTSRSSNVCTSYDSHSALSLCMSWTSFPVAFG
jgi:hypothetical protein